MPHKQDARGAAVSNDRLHAVLETEQFAEAVPTEAAIGITAFNEEENIGSLIADLLEFEHENIKKIYVVSSGSTDHTDEIVRKHARTSPKIELIAEPERTGKASAMNILLELAAAYDIMIFLGADNLIEKDTIPILLEGFEGSDVGIVGAHAQPLNGIRSFSDWCTHMLWNMHHLVSVRRPKVTGEMFAFRARAIRELPPGIINDDAYIQNVLQLKGYRAVYNQQATVHLMGPQNVREFFRQRRRIFAGHRQVRFLLGRPISTFTLRNLTLAKKAMPSRGLRGYAYMVGFVMVTGAAWITSLWDFFTQNLPYKWEMVRSTKLLNLGVPPAAETDAKSS